MSELESGSESEEDIFSDILPPIEPSPPKAQLQQTILSDLDLASRSFSPIKRRLPSPPIPIAQRKRTRSEKESEEDVLQRLGLTEAPTFDIPKELQQVVEQARKNKKILRGVEAIESHEKQLEESRIQSQLLQRKEIEYKQAILKQVTSRCEGLELDVEMETAWVLSQTDNQTDNVNDVQNLTNFRDYYFFEPILYNPYSDILDHADDSKYSYFKRRDLMVEKLMGDQEIDENTDNPNTLSHDNLYPLPEIYWKWLIYEVCLEQSDFVRQAYYHWIQLYCQERPLRSTINSLMESIGFKISSANIADNGQHEKLCLPRNLIVRGLYLPQINAIVHTLKLCVQIFSQNSTNFNVETYEDMLVKFCLVAVDSVIIQYGASAPIAEAVEDLLAEVPDEKWGYNTRKDSVTIVFKTLDNPQLRLRLLDSLGLSGIKSERLKEFKRNLSLAFFLDNCEFEPTDNIAYIASNILLPALESDAFFKHYGPHIADEPEKNKRKVIFLTHSLYNISKMPDPLKKALLEHLYRPSTFLSRLVAPDFAIMGLHSALDVVILMIRKTLGQVGVL